MKSKQKNNKNGNIKNGWFVIIVGFVADDIELLIILLCFFFKISSYVVKHHSKVENDF
jgi:hypothetical protein